MKIEKQIKRPNKFRLDNRRGVQQKKKKNRGGEGSEIMNKGAENCCNNEGLTS